MRRFLAIVLWPVGYILRYGHCLKCKATWLLEGGKGLAHITEYTQGSEAFPLCEHCWASLTPKRRLAYYRQHIDDCNDCFLQWPLIVTAVLAGK